MWCAEALAGLSGAVVRAAVTGGLQGPSGKGLESLLLFLSKALLLDAEDPGESSDDEEEPLTRTRGFGPVKGKLGAGGRRRRAAGPLRRCELHGRRGGAAGRRT